MLKVKSIYVCKALEVISKTQGCVIVATCAGILYLAH